MTLLMGMHATTDEHATIEGFSVEPSTQDNPHGNRWDGLHVCYADDTDRGILFGLHGQDAHGQESVVMVISPETLEQIGHRCIEYAALFRASYDRMREEEQAS